MKSQSWWEKKSWREAAFLFPQHEHNTALSHHLLPPSVSGLISFVGFPSAPTIKPKRWDATHPGATFLIIFIHFCAKKTQNKCARATQSAVRAVSMQCRKVCWKQQTLFTARTTKQHFHYRDFKKTQFTLSGIQKCFWRTPEFISNISNIISWQNMLCGRHTVKLTPSRHFKGLSFLFAYHGSF